jgi:uncharacterized membrane protein YkoI
MSILNRVALAAAAGLVAASGAYAKPMGGHEYQSLAKVSLQQARGIAAKARPGKITDQELEKEGGGTGLRYSFDITSAGKTFEVGVDARTGKVLENKAEGADAD